MRFLSPMKLPVNPSVLKASVVLILMCATILLGVAQASAIDSTPCTNQDLASQLNSEQTGVSEQTAVSLAQSSSQYESFASTASALTYYGITNSWEIDSVSCSISWQSDAVNFAMKSTNGSNYDLVVTENPKTSVVYSAEAWPQFAAQPQPLGAYVGYGTTYSGYGISGASNPEVLGVELDFSQPTVSLPSGTKAPGADCNVHQSVYDICELTTWAGLADSKYTGPGGNVTTGGVVQTGTLGIVEYNSMTSTTTITYAAFSEDYESSNSQNLANICASGDTPSASDSMYADVENEYIVNGGTGDEWYTDIIDNTENWACTTANSYTASYYTDSFTPIYAEAIAERPSNSTGSTQTAYSLPEFSSFTFDEYNMYVSSWTGVYSNYNNDYGFGVQMLNDGTQNTQTPAMTDQSGSGEFTEGWDTSVGT